MITSYNVADPMATHDLDPGDLRCRTCGEAESTLVLFRKPCLDYCLRCNHKATGGFFGTVCDNCGMSDIGMI